MTEPIKLRSNEYWGRKSGSVAKDGTRIFKGKRAGNNKSSNSGPTGRALRRRPGNPTRDIGRPRNYRNQKLSRPSALGAAKATAKGAKRIA